MRGEVGVKGSKMLKSTEKVRNDQNLANVM